MCFGNTRHSAKAERSESRTQRTDLFLSRVRNSKNVIVAGGFQISSGKKRENEIDKRNTRRVDFFRMFATGFLIASLMSQARSSAVVRGRGTALKSLRTQAREVALVITMIASVAAAQV
jgi:hypothetical protein